MIDLLIESDFLFLIGRSGTARFIEMNSELHPIVGDFKVPKGFIASTTELYKRNGHEYWGVLFKKPLGA